MASFLARIEQMDQSGNRFLHLYNREKEFAGDMLAVRQKLQNDISVHGNIDKRIMEAMAECMVHAEFLEMLAKTLHTSAELYRNVENSLIVQSAEQKTIHSSVNAESKEIRSRTGIDLIDDIINFIFFDNKTGLEGASGVCGLGGSVSALMQLILKLCGVENSGHLGILSSISNFFGDLFDAFDMEGKSLGEIAADFLDSGGSLADAIAAVVGRNSGGLISSTGQYAAVFSGGTGFVGELIQRLEEYGADGNLDMGDWSEALVHSSVEGLYNMVNSLVSGVTGGNINLQNIISAEEISNGMLNFVDNYTENASEYGIQYIENNPEMKKAYNEGGQLERFILINIAIYKRML